MGGLLGGHKEPWNLGVFEGKSLSYAFGTVSIIWGVLLVGAAHRASLPAPARAGPGKVLVLSCFLGEDHVQVLGWKLGVNAKW